MQYHKFPIAIILITIIYSITVNIFQLHFVFRNYVPVIMVSITIAVTPILLAHVFSNLLLKKKSAYTVAIGFVVSLYYLLEFFLGTYFILRLLRLDFYFFWFNKEVALKTISLIDINYLYGILLLFFWFFLFLFAIVSVLVRPENNGRDLGPLKFILMIGLIVLVIRYGFVSTFASDTLRSSSSAKRMYTKLFFEALKANKEQLPDITEKSDNNLFFVQLESLNALLVNETNAPGLMKIAQDGVLFNNVQGASIHTIRGQEAILCPILTSPNENLSMMNIDHTKLVCLPKIMKQLGYTTIYMQGFDLNFANAKNFMRDIGFDEVYSDELMQSEDQKVAWGYRDDVFIKRVFEFLEKRKGEKLFVYFILENANHFPFFKATPKEYPEFVDKVPFKTPKTYEQGIANTTYIQDALLLDMYNRYFISNYSDNTDLLIMGDHSWPVGRHESNIYNENMAYQENFVTSLVFVPAKNRIGTFVNQKKVDHLVSQLDIAPTIFELNGVNKVKSVGVSFLRELKSNSAQNPAQGDRCFFSVQPYSDKYIVVIKENIKYIFNDRKDTVTKFNLKTDPEELYPTIAESKEGLDLLKHCLEKHL